MPELPEVETCRRGIAPHIVGKRIQSVTVRDHRLRWPVTGDLAQTLSRQRLEDVQRRGKYLLLRTQGGTLIVHLGMSGRLRIVSPQQAPVKHDHVDICFEDDTILRFNDARRFGAVLWTADSAEQHMLLAALGPEPLSDDFNGRYLALKAKNRQTPIKSLIMDSHVVVGAGNIYANEALFMAGINPLRLAGSLSADDCHHLANAIKTVLQRAIEQGGTTLRDFTDPAGNPGYFQQTLAVYGRADQPCTQCGEPIQLYKISQRATYSCSRCQK